LWSSADSKVFEEITGGLFGWSGLITSRTLEDDERVKRTIPPLARQCHYIEVKTLDSVLSSAGLSKIDYLCLDIEGAELEVLSVFPFHKYDIDVLSVEDNTECNHVLAELIAQNGFEHLTRIGPDEIWRKIR
jgi:hypothetical protein